MAVQSLRRLARPCSVEEGGRAALPFSADRVRAETAFQAFLTAAPQVPGVRAPNLGEPGRADPTKDERRLLRAIMNPAMISAWIFGVTLVLTPGVVDWSAGWWHGKLAGLLGMTWFHHHLSTARKDFAADGRHRTERYWRILNEVPTLLMIAAVVMVIVKPF